MEGAMFTCLELLYQGPFWSQRYFKGLWLLLSSVRYLSHAGRPTTLNHKAVHDKQPK